MFFLVEEKTLRTKGIFTLKIFGKNMNNEAQHSRFLKRMLELMKF